MKRFQNYLNSRESAYLLTKENEKDKGVSNLYVVQFVNQGNLHPLSMVNHTSAGFTPILAVF